MGEPGVEARKRHYIDRVSRDEVKHVSKVDEVVPSPAPVSSRWGVGLVSFFFILVQSACTMVMAVSGVRVVIGLSALAAAAGLHRPASGFHEDAIRIPMMFVAGGGSLLNLYVIWRVRSLRSRPASAWRVAPVTPEKRRGENWQIALAVVTLVLVAAEYATHRIVHGM